MKIAFNVQETWQNNLGTMQLNILSIGKYAEPVCEVLLKKYVHRDNYIWQKKNSKDIVPTKLQCRVLKIICLYPIATFCIGYYGLSEYHYVILQHKRVTCLCALYSNNLKVQETVTFVGMTIFQFSTYCTVLVKLRLSCNGYGQRIKKKKKKKKAMQRPCKRKRRTKQKLKGLLKEKRKSILEMSKIFDIEYLKDWRIDPSEPFDYNKHKWTYLQLVMVSIEETYHCDDEHDMSVCTYTYAYVYIFLKMICTFFKFRTKQKKKKKNLYVYIVNMYTYQHIFMYITK
ncbi:hypothetical protein RFI_35859 [Reticulomyxa filosa]|uniref:Uncharacterized protein n=1 Tax=Reticulomyxa filosa TaxID=46433 RepID=X6LJN4_RETFI|nr:hypothetical protein RFI_35859 [Reticulomyxa filosa]|eukprot:ETO01581.1 hypothetical protein RFI_35859 [Reticulomyxa filosa]